MIDKNDVKMPEQKEDIESLLNDKEQVRKIEDLLDLVNSTENRQELRLKEDYYSRFHWFGNSVGRNDKSYFSYQEEAVYDFIFNLNKSGILSDQVGMGKTIEAGMIISELASRNELRSLLIIVPNEIMAQKWEYELEDKFGIKPYVRYNSNGEKEVYPQVKAMKNYDDFCRCIFECIAEEKFVELAGEDAWWRSTEGSNLGAPYTKVYVNGHEMIGWADEPWEDEDEEDEFEIYASNLSDYLCDVVGASQPKNVCALAVDLAKYNNMTMAELFTKYEG